MKKTLKKTGYSSPHCEKISITPQAQLLQVVSNTINPATLDAFDVYDDSIDPYFG